MESFLSKVSGSLISRIGLLRKVIFFPTIHKIALGTLDSASKGFTIAFKLSRYLG